LFLPLFQLIVVWSVSIFLNWTQFQIHIQAPLTSPGYYNRRVCHVVMSSIHFHLTTFQSPFADLYLVLNATLPSSQHPGLTVEYHHGDTWLPVPTAATRPLSCSPGASVFSGQRGLPLVHSCRCPVDRQLASQPACRLVRSWRCRFVTEFQSDCAHRITLHVSAVSFLTLARLVP